MSGYTKPCIFCKQEIRLSNDSGKWLPYNLDNTSHECKNTKSSQSQPQLQPQIKITLTIEELEQRLTKIEELFGKRLSKIENLLFAIDV